MNSTCIHRKWLAHVYDIAMDENYYNEPICTSEVAQNLIFFLSHCYLWVQPCGWISLYVYMLFYNVWLRYTPNQVFLEWRFRWLTVSITITDGLSNSSIYILALKSKSDDVIARNIKHLGTVDIIRIVQKTLVNGKKRSIFKKIQTGFIRFCKHFYIK